jgi:hypothetical protein
MDRIRTGGMQVPDLDRHEVRVQFADSDGDFRTAWWGTVETQLEVDMGPASPTPYGAREYHCEGGVKRLKRWPLVRHGIVRRRRHPDRGRGRPSRIQSSRAPTAA